MHNAPPDKNPPRMDANGLGAGVRAALEKFLFETTRGHGLILQWPEGQVVGTTLSAETILGYALSDWKKPGFFQRVIHPEDLKKISHLHDSGLPFMPGLESEFRMFDPEGKTIRVRAQARLHPDQSDYLMVVLFEIHQTASSTAPHSNDPWEEIFALAPFPQFCADFSGVKALLETWKNTGVKDFQEFFQGNPAHLRECVARIKVLHANSAAAALFDSESEKDLLDTFHRLSNPLSFRMFGLAVRRLAEGNQSFEESVGSYAEATHRRELKIRVELLSGYRVTWSNVIIWILENRAPINPEVEPTLGSDSLYRQMFETSPSILLIVDPDSGRIVDANPAACQFYGAARTQMKMLNISQLAASPSEAVFQEMAFTKTSLRPKRGVRMVQKLADGQVSDVELNFAPISFQSRILLACSVVSGPEINRTQDALLKASRMEATATLAGGIAHDFNNLMAVVLGNASLLSQHPTLAESERDKMLGEISSIAEKAGQLAQQLLSFARGGKYTPEVLKLNKVVKKAIELQGPAIPQRITVQFDLDDDLWTIKADPTQIEQVIVNLSLNACESISGTGSIRISTRNAIVDDLFARPDEGFPPGQYVCLTIQDSGIGMSAETQSRIFEPYFSTKSRGRGLGMAAVYGIVRNHQGQIFVLSEAGKGSNFTIYLPAVLEAQPVRKIPEKSVVSDVGPCRILLIDDDEMVVSVSKRMLEHLGYHVTIARNGQEAVDIAKSNVPAFGVALLDMGMPVMDGYQAFPLLKAARPDMKIIICTGYHLDAVSQQLLGTGASGFLRKPFNLETLQNKLKKVLNPGG